MTRAWAAIGVDWRVDVTTTDADYTLRGTPHVVDALEALLASTATLDVTPTGPTAATATDDLAVVAALARVAPSSHRLTGAPPTFPSVPGRVY